jgi:hypothetical protein
MECSYYLKKNIGPNLYYIVRNESHPTKIWNALEKHFGLSSKIHKRNIKRQLREITIQSLHFDIELYLSKKADAIDALIAADMTVDDEEMCDLILEGLEKDYRFSDFIFFHSSKEQADYISLINHIREYSQSKAFGSKYKTKNFRSKNEVNYTNSHRSVNKSRHCEFCKKKGHTVEYCFKNPKSKNFKGKKDDSSMITNESGKSVVFYTPTEEFECKKNEIILDSGASSHFFGNRNVFLSMTPVDEYLSTSGSTLRITHIGDVLIKTRYKDVILRNVKFCPELKTNLVSMIQLEEKGVSYSRDKNARTLKYKGEIVEDLYTIHGLLKFKTTISRDSLYYNVHQSLGHISLEKAKHLSINLKHEEFYPCSICIETKSTRKTPNRERDKPHRHLYEVLHYEHRWI